MTFETIKKRSDFVLATSKGARFSTGTLILQRMRRNDQHPVGPAPRFGFTVTKKMGNAVARNRIKRRLREALRAMNPQYTLNGHDYVLISRHKIIGCDFDVILRDMEFAFLRMSAMKDTHLPTKPNL